MPKPTFLNVTKVVADKQPIAGALSLSTADPLKIEVPIKIPEDYPANRTLQVYVFDETTGAMVASAKKPLQQVSRKEGEHGASVIEVALPAVSREGNYLLASKLTADVAGEVGPKEVPVACDTAVIQPRKARSCRLLSLHVRH
jgi:hypothetical protein